jgi:muconate cycloisomerase
MTEEICFVDARIVDLPIRRPHRIGSTMMRGQSCVVVRVRTADGLTGVGEGVVPGGGPGWGGESVDSIKVTIDAHLGPALCDGPVRGANEAIHRMHVVSAGNHFAKAAIEMALWDIAGKRLGRPVHELLGGLHRDEIDVLWSLGADTPDPLGEAQRFIAEGHRTIKFMLGGRSPEADVERVIGVLEKLPEGLTYIVDANGKWDEPTARRWLPVLAGAGVGIAEQLVPAWNRDAMARLTGATRAWVMADESVRTLCEAVAVARLHAAEVIAVKVPKLGGIAAARDVAAVARGAGLRCYGGGTMETSIGTSAAAQVFGTFPELVGSDLIGPIMRTEDVVTEPLAVRNGRLPIPNGPGLGVELDEDKIRYFSRE